ncbi:hypothetical protein HHI36_022273 [Cryptolaemus montrouzieri]|uniref:Uncharacterized protein n=1 Tax=Cryptolaemus montrouzieri TaxID=559131 RepID=A0ABD2MZ84_9CUCU
MYWGNFSRGGKTAILLDISIPADDNLERAYSEKITKYSNTTVEIKEIYSLRSVGILPLIMLVNIFIERHLVDNTDKILKLTKGIVSSVIRDDTDSQGLPSQSIEERYFGISAQYQLI